MQLNHICFFVASIAVAYGVCPSGWTSYQNNCFFLSRDNNTMAGAQVMCGIVGKQYDKQGQLAVVNDNGTDQFLFNLIDASNQNSYWIGVNDIVEEGKWMFAGTRIKATYTNWGKDQPNNRGGTEHCTVMRGNTVPFPGLTRTWTDDPCTDINYYICEITQISGAGILG